MHKCISYCRNSEVNFRLFKLFCSFYHEIGTCVKLPTSAQLSRSSYVRAAKFENTNEHVSTCDVSKGSTKRCIVRRVKGHTTEALSSGT